jgi:membrane protein
LAEEVNANTDRILAELAGEGRDWLHVALVAGRASVDPFGHISPERVHIELIKSAVRDFFKDRCGTAAAAVAYFSVFALPPVLLLALAATARIFGQDVAARGIDTELEAIFAPEVADQVRMLLQSAWQNSGRGWLGFAAGASGILLAGTRAFVELQRVLNRAWEVEPVGPPVKRFALKRVTAFLMIIAVTIVLLTSMVISVVVPALGRSVPDSVFLLSLWQTFAPFIILTLLVAAIFKVLPDAKVEWRDVLFGAVFTGGVLAIGKYAFSFYFTHGSIATVWGTMGTFVLLLLWLYLSSATLLFGAELTHVRARREGREMKPDEGAVRSGKPPDNAVA